MTTSPADAALLKRLAPGALCREGFLAGHAGTLADLLTADAAAVRHLGLTHEAIAARLEEPLAAAMAACGAPVPVGPHLTATCREAMGRIACPWPGCGVFPKGEVELLDSRTGRRALLTPLSVHLVARHGFYQGPAGRYRLEPTGIADMLDMCGEGRKDDL